MAVLPPATRTPATRTPATRTPTTIGRAPGRRALLPAAGLAGLALAGGLGTHAALAARAQGAVERDYGITVTSLSVTADGGMLGLRYTVVDPAKAHPVLGPGGHGAGDGLDGGTAPAPAVPMIRDEASGRTVYAVAMQPHITEPAAGGHYYVLYRNQGGVIQPGHRVTVVVGRAERRHVLAG